ncbi:hypothetical protein FQN54_003060 [Arachnomyces sp. PD_36]|nr:hypothetical protein FQN54_003060 [Arachnomyces sp. PD_36]
MGSKSPQRPPFRAEHIGSLLRTDELLKKREEVERGEASDSELNSIENRDIDAIVKTQFELGYHAITDGEYRRHMFWGSFFPGLEGMTEVKHPDIDIFRLYMPDIAAFTESGYKPGETVICTGKIRHVGSQYLDQFKYLRNLVPAEKVKDIKLTLAAPNWYHLRYREGKAYPKEVYGSDEEYFADIAKAYQEELQILYDAGLRNVQFDDPNLAYFCSEKMLAGWKEDKGNTYTPDQLFDAYVRLYNDCISKRPADMHVGVHLCRGNFVKSRHFSEGGYDRIAARLFRDLAVDTYYLEYDTERAGSFEPLKELPKNKNVILGVVTSKFGVMEDLTAMKTRVLGAAEIIAGGNNETVPEALARMGVSPQCGFASHSSGNALDRDDMLAKLKLVRELANSIWPGEP